MGFQNIIKDIRTLALVKVGNDKSQTLVIFSLHSSWESVVKIDRVGKIDLVNYKTRNINQWRTSGVIL